MRYFKDAVKFLNDIKKTDEVVIVFNNDGDGICSCTLVMKFLELTGRHKPYIIPQPMPMDKNLVQRVKTTVPNKIIFLDLVVDQQEDVVKKLRGFADILIIDHHQIKNNINGKNVVFFNPRFDQKDIYTSATYNTYKICAELVDLKKYLWVAAVGIVADYELKYSMDLVNQAKELYKVDDLYGSFIGRIADMIFSTHATKELSCEQIAELFMKVDDVKKIGNVPGYEKMVNSHRIIEEELAAIMEDAKSSLKKEGNLVLYNIKSKYNLGSIISTKIGEHNKDKLVIVYARKENRYKVSSRNQKKNIDAGKVLQAAVKGLKASGGGHEAAAGAAVDEKDWNTFLERVKEMVNKD